MFKVAVCDDDSIFLEIIKDKLERLFISYSTSYSIETYASSLEFFGQIQSDEYDIVFLDIEMQGKDGIDIANQIGKKYPDTYVIFITNREDMVFEALKSRPYGFIRKIEFDREIGPMLSNLLRLMDKINVICEMSSNNSYIKMKSDDVMYFEVKLRHIFINSSEGKHRIKGKITEIEKRLEPLGFLRCHSSYLVNMKNILIIRNNVIVLDNHMEVPMGKKFCKYVNDNYMHFIRQQIYQCM